MGYWSPIGHSQHSCDRCLSQTLVSNDNTWRVLRIRDFKIFLQILELMKVEGAPDYWTVHFLDRRAAEMHPGVAVRCDCLGFHLKTLALVVIANAEVSIFQESLHVG